MRRIIYFASMLFLFTVENVSAQQANTLNSREWKEDIHFILNIIESEHPNPYWRISKEKFTGESNKLLSDLDKLTNTQIQVRMIQLVASLQDGHTELLPYGPHGFNSIFPIRAYQFTDGLFITGISKEYKNFAGSEILEIGKFNAMSALELTSTMWNNENEFRKLDGSVFYLTSPEALKTLGIIDDIEVLPLKVKLQSGEIMSLEIRSVAEEFNLDFVFRGEMWGPGEISYITGIDKLAAKSYYDETNEEMPLHLRYRSKFWFNYIDENQVLYLQINTLGDSKKEKFSSFLDRLWTSVDTNPIDKFVLDNRYNVGGDGSKVNEIVHGFIKRDKINSPEKLFTVLGRATFSAGINLASSMKVHTKSTFIGTPAGAYHNHNGDAETFMLPNSEMELGVSTIWHQPFSSKDKNKLIPIDIPVEFSSSDYFGKKDPVMDFIINTRYEPIKNLILNFGAVKGIEEYNRRKAKYRLIDWWHSYTEYDWNSLGYELSSLGKKEDALVIFQYNTSEYPQSWKACDGLAEMYAEMGKKKDAIKWYKKALQIDPLNFNAGFQKEMISILSK